MGPKRQSLARKSVSKRGSVKRGSMKRGSVKRGSMKRGSVKRGSMKRGSIKKKTLSSEGRKKSVLSHGGKSKYTEEEADVPFKAVTLSVTDIRPFLILMRCQERSLVLRALDYLYAYIRKNPEGTKLLYEKAYMGDVKTLAQTEEKYIPIAAMKLLAEVSMDPASHKYFRNDREFLEDFLFFKLSSKEEPGGKWEQYSTKIMAELTKDVNYVKELLLKEDTKFKVTDVVNNLNSTNPDVQHNALIIMSNVFKDILSAEKFVNRKDFRLTPLFHCLESKYIEIQRESLDILLWLMWHKNTKELKQMFFDEGGIDVFFKFLNNFQWRDMHAEALEIFKWVLEDDEDKVRMLDPSKGVGKFVSYIDFCEDDDLIAKVFENILEISATVYGKEELINLGFIPKIVSVLSDGTPSMKLGACRIINEMLTSMETIRLFTELDPIPPLAEIIIDPDSSWELVGAALCCAHNLLKVSSDLSYLLVKQPLKGRLRDWITEALPRMPVKHKKTFYYALSAVMQHSTVKPYLLGTTLVKALLSGIQEKDPSDDGECVRIAAAEALFHIMPSEKYARQFILKVGGPEIIAQALKTARSPMLIAMLCNVIRAAAETNRPITVGLLNQQVLDFLVQRKKMWLDVQEMEWAAMTLQEKFLQMKFEYQGRLGLKDTTKDDFYVRREQRKPNTFPMPPIDDGMKVDSVIYSCNSSDRSSIRESTGALDPYFDENRDEKIKIDQLCATTYQMGYEEDKEKSDLVALKDDAEYREALDRFTIKCKPDSELKQYLSEVNKRLDEIDSKFGLHDHCQPFDHQWVRDRVKVITEVVTNALGKNNLNKQFCSSHSFKHYLTELKVKTDSSIIPIGSLGTGGTFEKALLFKILADRIGLPCTLWRGEHGNAWNEISLINLGKQLYFLRISYRQFAVMNKCILNFMKGADFPLRNKEETKVKTEDKPDMPTRLMYVTHVVDLEFQPGRLLEVKSPEALHYTGRPVESLLFKVEESRAPPLDLCFDLTKNKY